MYAQDAASAQAAFNSSLANTSSANAAYMNQAAAAVPVVEAQTAGTIAQIRAQQEQDRLDRQEAAAQRAFAAQQRSWQVEDRAAELEANGGLSPAEVKAQEDAAKDLEKRAAAARDGILRASKREDVEGEYALLDTITGTADTLGQAVKYMDSLVEEAAASGDDDVSLPGWQGATSRANLLRRLYAYYNLENPESDPQKFGEQMHASGINPTRVPGYTPKPREAQAAAPTQATGRDPAPGSARPGSWMNWPNMPFQARPSAERSGGSAEDRRIARDFPAPQELSTGQQKEVAAAAAYLLGGGKIEDLEMDEAGIAAVLSYIDSQGAGYGGEKKPEGDTLADRIRAMLSLTRGSF